MWSEGSERGGGKGRWRRLIDRKRRVVGRRIRRVRAWRLRLWIALYFGG